MRQIVHHGQWPSDSLLEIVTYEPHNLREMWKTWREGREQAQRTVTESETYEENRITLLEGEIITATF